MCSKAGKPRVIAITGGIGTGKSVVSRLLHIMGYPVYDCDQRARWVMTHDGLLRQQLVSLFGPDTYLSATAANPTGEYQLNKPYLARQIFSSPHALAQMNACVHPAVARDLIDCWCRYSGTREAFFFESAILYESHFDQLSHPDEVWTVSAPLELRIARAMQRDAATRQQVLDRIASQMPQEEKEKRADQVIVNDDRHSIIEQLNIILNP